MTETIFSTPRLGFRELVPDDSAIMLRMHTDEAIMRHLGMPPWHNSEESLDYIFKNLKSYSDNGFGRWVVLDNQTGDWLGLAGLLVDQHEGFVDLGYRFFPEYWGKGLATESVGAVLKYGFEDLALPEVQARVLPENKSSIRVLEKAGLQKVGPTVCMGLKALSYALNAESYRKQAREGALPQ